MLELECDTVGQCLNEIVTRYPGTREWLFEKDGTMNNLVEIYVNMESAHAEGLAKPVRDGDALHIILIITGG